MFDGIKRFFTRLGVRMGIIKDLSKLDEHKKIDINEDFLKRVELNKGIYQGYVEDWHKISYINSRGDKKERTRLTLGMGKILSQNIAQLIFNEKCVIDVSTRGIDSENQKDTAKEFINQVLDSNNFYRDFQRYLEYGYALSGIAIKPYAHNGKIKLTYATADSFIPLSNDSNNIDEAVFITREKKNKKHYTLLEWHEWEGDLYVITNELFESDKADNLGHKVPLSTIYENLEPRVEIEFLTRPLFTYIKLNTANNKDLDSPLGISIFENSYNTLYMIDYLYDYLLHEFKLGKRRIAVDYSLTKPRIDESGNVIDVFDTDETVFKALNLENTGVQDLSVGLRVDEIVKAINTALDILAMQTGLSSGTFTFDGQSIRTATEVVSINSKTYQTKNSHETIVEHSLKELITSIIEVANLYGIYTGNSDVEVQIDFDDSIAQDREQNYSYYSNGFRDGLLPKKEAIKRIYSITDKEAEEWIKEISQDQLNTMSLAMQLQAPEEESDYEGIEGAKNREGII